MFELKHIPHQGGFLWKYLNVACNRLLGLLYSRMGVVNFSY